MAPRRMDRGRRRRSASSQRRVVALVLAALVGVAVTGVVTHHSRSATPRVAGTRHRPHVVRLSPPPPIPGYLLIADRGNNRILLVDGAKRVLWRYPAPGTSPPMAFRYDDDTFFGPKRDRIISNQEDQHTIQIVSFPGGRLLWRYGHVDTRGAAPGYLNTPDDAYLLPNGTVSVADAYNCRVLFIDRAHRVVRSYGRAGDCRHAPPAALGPINGATPLADGGTLISEIPGSWVDDIGPTGRLRWAVQAPVSYPSDPQLLAPGRILLADYARPGHALIMNSHGRVLWRYGPPSGPGELDHPSLAFRVAPGLIGINDDYRDRVVIVDMHTNKIVWQYGHTDQPGSAGGYLHTPDGLDVLPTKDAQRSPVLRALLTPKARPPTHAQPRSKIAVTAASFRLPAPVERAVAAASGRAILIAGGLDAAGSSTNGVFRLDPTSGHVTALGSVPQPFHDAAGAMIGGALYVFGGGATTSSAAVQRFDPVTRRGVVVGRLPRPLSDLVSATIGGTVYLVGGYDGVTPRREIYSTTDGSRFRVVARLPQAVRYPAVAAVGNELVVAGGTGPAGPSDAVYAFVPSTGLVRRIGSLPTAIGHAAAVAFGGSVYVVGGVDAAGRTVSSVTEIAGARVARVAGVTGAVSDAAVAQLGSSAYLIGGRLDGRAVSRTLVVTQR
jgi:hypothetical protein